jgi:hypothetical protein
VPLEAFGKVLNASVVSVISVDRDLSRTSKFNSSSQPQSFASMRFSPDSPL